MDCTEELALPAAEEKNKLIGEAAGDLWWKWCKNILNLSSGGIFLIM